MPGVRVDCYLSVMRKFEKEYPGAHFENVTRQFANSVLSPSWGLLFRYKNGRLTFEDFTSLLFNEIVSNGEAVERIKYLQELSKTKTVFLVCVEKDPEKCHRSFIKKMIEESHFAGE